MFSLNTGGGKSKLASIEYLDEEQEVYDFYVPEGNEYIANGIASHNTAMAVNVLRNMTEFALEDCCFPKGTLVDTVCGPKPIESLMPGENVHSFNKTTRQVEVKPVTGVSAIKSSQRLVRIRHAGGVFECTEDHEIWCDQVGSYVKASELKPGMKLTINTSS